MRLVKYSSVRNLRSKICQSHSNVRTLSLSLLFTSVQLEADSDSDSDMTEDRDDVLDPLDPEYIRLRREASVRGSQKTKRQGSQGPQGISKVGALSVLCYNSFWLLAGAYLLLHVTSIYESDTTPNEQCSTFSQILIILGPVLVWVLSMRSIAVTCTLAPPRRRA